MAAVDSEAILGSQHDIYQRYAFLVRLLEAVLHNVESEAILPAPSALRVLDVGSGPTPLTEAFLPTSVEIVRADIDQFGDERIVKLTPGGPLPFLDESFDLVLALDVLDHMPREERPAFVGECLRVGRRAVILCCPVAHPKTLEAERHFLAGARALSSRAIASLLEHERFGLPSAADVERALRRPGWHVLAFDNAPLDEWLVFNLADLIYTSEFGDGTRNHRFNAVLNRETCFLRPDGAHYRRFFCGFRDLRDHKAVARLVEREGARSASPVFSVLAAGASHALISLRHDLVEASAARAAQMSGQLTAQHDLLAATQAHVGRLESALRDAHAQVRALEAMVSGRSGQLALGLRRWREHWFPSGSRQLRVLDQVLRWFGWRQQSVDHGDWLAYEAWRARQAPSASVLEHQLQRSAIFPLRPLISIVSPVYNTPLDALRAMLDSVLAQSYPHWELCLVDGGSTASTVSDLLRDYADRDARVRVRCLPRNLGISGNSNVALEMAHGEFVALLDHDDVLEPHALFAVAEALNRQPETDVFYSDHDVLSADGRAASHPVFKPAWSPDLMLSANYLTHLTVLRTALVREVGGFIPDTDGAQDWDLFLRIVERTSRIVHLPLVLYHWRNSPGSTARDIRAKTRVPETQLRVIERHLTRQGLIAPRAHFDASGFIRVGWTYDRQRLVSIIIPSRGANPLLERCIQSILARTAYPSLEILVVNNGPEPPAAFGFYERITRDPRVRVVHDDRPFNYSAANNRGARLAKGELLLFLNNDTEVMAPDWLDELVMWAARPAVGLVGAKLLFPNGRIQHAGVVLGLTGFAGHLFAGAVEGQDSCFGWAEWYRNFLSVTAACLLTRRDVFERLGGFDEEFTLCGSDVDLGLRAHELGYRVVYNPFARVRHHESATHRGTIPAEDFKVSLRRYRQWLERGDPYFNANLSYWRTVPSLGQPNEPDQLTFAIQYVAALDDSHAAP